MSVPVRAVSVIALCCGLACCTLCSQSSPATESSLPGAAVAANGSMDQPGKLAAQMPVARLSRLAGSATVQAEDGTTAPIDAALNMPLPAGERLSTGDNGEAEVEFADGSVLRMTPRSDAGVERIDPESHATSLQLGSGLFYLELRSSDRSVFAVSAAELQIAPEQNASFRLRVQDGQVEAAVLAGSISVTRANAYTVVVQAGESLRTDPKNGRRYLLLDTVKQDTWDSWNEQQAQAVQDEAAARTPVRDGYSGDQAYGWADLDANGTWYNVPGEGEIWQPTLADASFDPYGSGAWVYGPGGYAWASGYGWGWLPYRCGAWSFYQGFGWGWSPASGCLSFGFSGGYGGDGGYRVHYPRNGWHPPHRPVFAGDLGGKGYRHPTVPVIGSPDNVGGLILGNRGKTGEPVRVAGVLATPVKQVGPVNTRPVATGGSAVGSSLLRDFPVRPGTHDLILGVRSEGAVTTPTQVRDGFRRGSPAAGTFGQGAGSAEGRSGRGPVPTDPPLGATGAPPFGGTGAPPFGGTGRPGSGPAPVSPGVTRLPAVQPRMVIPAQPARIGNTGGTRPAPAAPMPRSAPPSPQPAPAPRPTPSPSAACTTNGKAEVT